MACLAPLLLAQERTSPALHSQGQLVFLDSQVYQSTEQQVPMAWQVAPLGQAKAPLAAQGPSLVRPWVPVRAPLLLLQGRCSRAAPESQQQRRRAVRSWLERQPERPLAQQEALPRSQGRAA